MQIGVAYYPEQWPKDRWETDAKAMVRFGVDVVRIGEFAWSSIEPRRERIELDWMEEAVDTFAEKGLKVILCTPTAAPPPWLFNRHKSILPQSADGRRLYYGSRRNVCLNNPAYLKYVRRIVTELAKRFGENPAIYAWQIDNELSSGPSGTCYCDECEQGFRMWLKRRYGTINRLNKMWGTSFWSQGFFDWHEVPTPRDTPGGVHPSLLLDYKRFTSTQTRSFIKRQKDIIEEYSSRRVPLTVNEPPPLSALQHINTFTLSDIQDVISLDNAPCSLTRLAETTAGLDFARSLKDGPFWVMQQQTGAGLTENASAQPQPGQLRLWAYQAAARGAELICFFRWRTAGAGQEMHRDGIIDSDGVPRRRYDELKQTVSELKNKYENWAGQMPVSRAAVFIDFESAWALEAIDLGCEVDYFHQAAMFHDILRRRGIAADFVSTDRELGRYDLVVAPMPFIASSRTTGSLELFTRRGGTLLVTAPAGCVSGANTTGEIRPPGALASLLGIEITEYDRLNSHNKNSVVFEDGQKHEAQQLCSIVEARGANPLAYYENNYYSGSPALTTARAEKGHSVFLAAGLDQGGLDKVLSYALGIAGMDDMPWSAGENVEFVELQTGHEKARKVFVLNHCATARIVEFHGDINGTELLSNTPFEKKLKLSPYQPALVEFHR